MERRSSGINNTFYEDLKEDWLQATNHPIALLRAENNVRNPWILQTIQQSVGPSAHILDIGCGGGLLTNFLASRGYQVTGIDLSASSLEIARQNAIGFKAEYLMAQAEFLPFPNESFDVVSAMDLLEHVENPKRVIEEASRVLKPGGLFFFHTFNRTWQSYLLVIKGVEWCVKNTPSNMHVFSLFIKPEEMEGLCKRVSLKVETWMGLNPKALSLPFWKMLWTREVPSDFLFTFTKSLKTGYVGIARKI